MRASYSIVYGEEIEGGDYVISQRQVPHFLAAKFANVYKRC